MEIAPGFNARSLLKQLRKQTNRTSDRSVPPIPNDDDYHHNQHQYAPLPQYIKTSPCAQDVQSTVFTLDDERYGPNAVRKIRVELEGEINGLREQLSSLKKEQKSLQTQNHELENRIFLNKQKSDEIIAELRYQLAVLRCSNPANTRKINASTGNTLLRSTGPNLRPPIPHTYSRTINRSSSSSTADASGFMGDNWNSDFISGGAIDTGEIEFNKVVRQLYVLKFGHHESSSQSTIQSNKVSLPSCRVDNILVTGDDVDPVNGRTRVMSGSSSETNVLTNIKDFNSKEDDVMS